MEVQKVIEHYNLSWNLGQAILLIIQAGWNELPIEEDLKQALWFLQREIDCLLGTKEKPQ